MATPRSLTVVSGVGHSRESHGSLSVGLDSLVFRDYQLLHVAFLLWLVDVTPRTEIESTPKPSSTPLAGNPSGMMQEFGKYKYS